MEERRDLPDCKKTLRRTSGCISPSPTKPSIDITNDHAWHRPTSESSSELLSGNHGTCINPQDCLTQDRHRDGKFRCANLRNQRPKRRGTEAEKAMMLPSLINPRGISAGKGEGMTQIFQLIDIPGLSQKNKVIGRSTLQDYLPFVCCKTTDIEVGNLKGGHWEEVGATRGASEGPGCSPARELEGTGASEGPGCSPARELEGTGASEGAGGGGRGRPRPRSQVS